MTRSWISARAAMCISVAFVVVVSVVAGADVALALPAGDSAGDGPVSGFVPARSDPVERVGLSDQAFGEPAAASSPTGTAAESFTQVSAGGLHSCGLRSDGSVVCWGSNSFGEAAAPSGSFTQISAGRWYSCGIRSDGSVVCWGDNRDGQTAAPSGSFTQISASEEHSCGLRSNGSAVCWGDNSDGQATAPSGSFTQISAGGDHSCGLRSNGSAVCWGDNSDGQTAPPSGSFTQISAGGDHSCGLRSNGSAVCWGDNSDGQATAPSGSFTQISAGGLHSCGLRSNGSAVCWGSNRDGQATAPSGSFTQMSAGRRHSCGLRSSGSAVCWGDNSDGQATAPSGSFTQVSARWVHSCGLRSSGSGVCWGDNRAGQTAAPSGSFTQVSAGGLHSCGLRSDGSAVCWGYNRGGQATAPSGSFTQVSAGWEHSCGLRSNGSAVCWGNNSPEATAPSGSFTQVSAGGEHSCGLRSDGSAVCWGDNRDGQTTVPSGSFTHISAGLWHSCGLRSDGSVVCWGSNSSWDSSWSGQATAPSGSFTQVSAGGEHSCGLRSDGSAVCWGDNRDGQTTVPSGSFTQVSAGGEHSCGLRSDGSAVCWGGRAAVLPAAGPVPRETTGGSELVVPGQVVGAGYELSDFGRNLFWMPVEGVTEYEVDALDVGADRADYRDDIRCVDSWERCEYLFDSDQHTSEVFRGASEFRIRAVNEAGKGPWSAWVKVGARVPGVVEGLRYLGTSRGVVLFWDRMSGVERYEVDARGVGGVRAYSDRSCRDRGCRYEVDEDSKVDGAFRAATGYRVRAVADAGKGPWSEWVTIEVSGRPGRVSDVRYDVGSRFFSTGTWFSRDGVRWHPVRGADNYVFQFQYPGDRTVTFDDVSEDDDRWEGCEDRCGYEFWRNAQRRVKVRVRAVNDAGEGPWSGWVWSVRRPAKPPQITGLIPDYSLFTIGADDVEVRWSLVNGAAGYRVEWRYLDYKDGIGDQIRAGSNAERLQTGMDALADSRNYRVIKPGEATVGVDDTSYVVKDVIDNSEDDDYVLEFRVTALGDRQRDNKASNWVRWNSQEIKSLLEEYKCETIQAVSIGHSVWGAISLILALYSGGLFAGLFAALSIHSQVESTLLTAGAYVEGCFGDQHPIELLQAMNPVIGAFLDKIGLTNLVKNVTCGNHYLGTRFKDKHFGYDDIDGLLEACYSQR